MLFEHMPYTNFHDINLEWLLRSMRDLQNYVKTTIEDFNNRLSATEDAITKEIADRKNADVQLQTQITNNYNTLSTRITNLNNKHDEDMLKIRGEIAAMYGDSVEYTDAQIAKVIAMIKALPSSPVFNYFRQKMCTIQHTFFDYYNWLRDHSFTAGEFDSSAITCGEFDALGKTALEWDMGGKDILHDFFKSMLTFMFDPYKGERVPVRHVVANLYQLHYTGLTCGEWDAMTFNANEFDAAGFTSYQLDWTKDPIILDRGDVTV